MIFVTNTTQMRKAEDESQKIGVSRAQLMKNAAAQCFAFIENRIGVKGKSFALLCGPGNNGGDGMQLAALIQERGGEAVILLTEKMPDTDTVRACMKNRRLIVPYALYTDNRKTAKDVLKYADVIVDCVFGTGFHGELPISVNELFEYVNSFCDGVKISVDIPSGCNGDSGAIALNAFKPDITLVLAAMKTGLLNQPCCDFCGETEILDIGINDSCYAEYDGIFTGPDDLSKLPPRPKCANKGTFGRLLNVAGSGCYIGAAVLSSKAALRAGTGLVTLAAPNRVINAAAASVPECVFLPLPQDENAFMDISAAELIEDAARSASAVAIGCGIGNTPACAQIVEKLLQDGNCPVILDADGINCISDNINILKNKNRPIILTPHPGEFARLLGIPTAQVQAERLELARRFAAETNTVLLLKGFYTVIAAPDGRITVNPSGSNALSKAGCGDVLTGIIAGLAAQGAEPYDAAVLGAYIHGKCADILTEGSAPASVLASDVIEALGRALLH